MAGYEGVSIKGDRGKKESEQFFYWSVPFGILYLVCCCLTHVRRTCPRNSRDIYGNQTKFSQANQRTISYVLDPFTDVTKRYNGQQATSCCVHHHGSETLRSPPWFRNRCDKFKLTRETPSAVHTQHEEHNERIEHTAVAGQPYNLSLIHI